MCIRDRTHSVLGQIPQREPIQRRLTELWNYPRVSVPQREAGQLFYRRNSGLQKQAPLYVRAALQAEPKLLLDPNTLSADGSVSLADWSPSPDGRYLAYASNEAGQFQIYVRPFPDVETGKWQVSTDGGLRPAWSRNGRELFYTKGSTLIAVPLQTAGSTFAWGNSVKLFDRPYAAPALERYYDVSPDGKRFLMIKESSPGDTITTTANMVVVLNWIEELKNRMSAK